MFFIHDAVAHALDQLNRIEWDPRSRMYLLKFRDEVVPFELAIPSELEPTLNKLIMEGAMATLLLAALEQLTSSGASKLTPLLSSELLAMVTEILEDEAQV